jgi:hypothetical protein
MSVPAIKALASVARGPIDVLVGSTPDDGGALEVMLELQKYYDCVGDVFVDRAGLDVVYDVAVLAIPFDGRWSNGTHFRAQSVVDARPRPGDPNVLGLNSWKKHEIEYQMDNARGLGYSGRTMSSCFTLSPWKCDEDLVYVGLGFKRDPSGFWSKKHWGNGRFIGFMESLKELRPQTRFITTCGSVDMPVVTDVHRGFPELKAVFASIRMSFPDVARAGSFFGNDTGMAHVAASFGRPTYMMTAFEGSEIKNPPACPRSKCNPFHTVAMDPKAVAADFADFVWGKQ